MSKIDENPIAEHVNPPKQGPEVVTRLRVEQDDSMFRIRRQSLQETNPSMRWLPYLIPLVYVPFVIGISFQGSLEIALILFALISLIMLIIWFGTRADFFDEEHLTITDSAVILETISPNLKRRKRLDLGPPQELQFKAISSKDAAGKITFWIGKENIAFSCDSIEQRNEILASLGEFMKRFVERPKGVLVPFRARNFFHRTNDGFSIELPSPYSRSSLGKKWSDGFLMIFSIGFFGGRLLWYIPNVVQLCFNFRQVFPPEQAVKMLVFSVGSYLIMLFLAVFLPLLLLCHSYWTGWDIRYDLRSGEATAMRSSLFGRKRIGSMFNRVSVYRKRQESILRLLNPMYWFRVEPIWQRDALVFDLEGRKFVLPCGSKEEADWLLALIRETGVEVIECLE